MIRLLKKIHQYGIWNGRKNNRNNMKILDSDKYINEKLDIKPVTRTRLMGDMETLKVKLANAKIGRGVVGDDGHIYHYSIIMCLSSKTLDGFNEKLFAAATRLKSHDRDRVEDCLPLHFGTNRLTEELMRLLRLNFGLIDNPHISMSMFAIDTCLVIEDVFGKTKVGYIGSVDEKLDIKPVQFL